MKKAKGTKKCVVKRNITFDTYLDLLFNDKILIRSQYVFRSYNHQVHTEKVNKIALSSKDDKRMQGEDKIKTYPYGYFEKTENELQILKENAHALRNNSIILREEAHAIRKTSSDIRNELKIIREEAHAIKNNANESHLMILEMK